MVDDEPRVWSLEDHLREGREAVAAIQRPGRVQAPAPVCHHFSELAPVDPVAVSVSDTYARLEPVFAELGLAFLSDRLEGWERCDPSPQWLEVRITALVNAASTNGLIYEGWTWEPPSGQPVGASTIHVINNKTAAQAGGLGGG